MTLEITCFLCFIIKNDKYFMRSFYLSNLLCLILNLYLIAFTNNNINICYLLFIFRASTFLFLTLYKKILRVKIKNENFDWVFNNVHEEKTFIWQKYLKIRAWNTALRFFIQVSAAKIYEIIYNEVFVRLRFS